MGVVMNSMGLYFTAVSTDIGFSMGGISMYKTIAGLSSCILLPFVGKVLYRFDTRFTLSASAAVMGVCTILMAGFQALWQWYLAASILGIASALLLTTSEPIILANWFHEKLGLVIGISAAFSGVMGMVCNMALERVIQVMGWRFAYVVTGILCLIMILPMTLFVVRLKPEMVGCEPYGRRMYLQVREEAVLPMSRRSRIAAMCALVLSSGVMLFCIGFSAQIVTYATTKGKTMATGAFLVSCSMIANAAGKVLLGQIYDVKGLKWICIAGTAFGIPAFGFLLCSDMAAMTVGSLLYGMAMSLGVVAPPLLTKKFFRGNEYPKAFSVVMMLSTLMSSFSTWILGWMYDCFGSYVPALALCMGMCMSFFVLCVGMWIHYRRLSGNRK